MVKYSWVTISTRREFILCPLTGKVLVTQIYPPTGKGAPHFMVWEVLVYTIDVKIKGIAPLLQHRFPMPELETMSKGGRKVTGAKDYTAEWKDYFYANSDGELFQPAVHIEGAMVRAAVNFRITGKRGKSYKDLFRAAVFVMPDEILHGIKVPNELDTDADKQLYLDLRPVVVQRARVVRIRPAFKAGWELDFAIEVLDDQIAPELVQDVLTLAGKTVGIGDYRPRFGRFVVTHFEVQQ